MAKEKHIENDSEEETVKDIRALRQNPRSREKNSKIDLDDAYLFLNFVKKCNELNTGLRSYSPQLDQQETLKIENETRYEGSPKRRTGRIINSNRITESFKVNPVHLFGEQRKNMCNHNNYTENRRMIDKENEKSYNFQDNRNQQGYKHSNQFGESMNQNGYAIHPVYHFGERRSQPFHHAMQPSELREDYKHQFHNLNQQRAFNLVPSNDQHFPPWIGDPQIKDDISHRNATIHRQYGHSQDEGHDTPHRNATIHRQYGHNQDEGHEIPCRPNGIHMPYHQNLEKGFFVKNIHRCHMPIHPPINDSFYSHTPIKRPKFASGPYYNNPNHMMQFGTFQSQSNFNASRQFLPNEPRFNHTNTRIEEPFTEIPATNNSNTSLDQEYNSETLQRGSNQSNIDLSPHPINIQHTELKQLSNTFILKDISSVKFEQDSKAARTNSSKNEHTKSSKKDK